MSLALIRTRLLTVLTIFFMWLATDGEVQALSMGAQTQYPNAGRVDFYKFTDASFDRFTSAPNSRVREWIRSHYVRMLTYSPYFDSHLSWYPNAWVYKNLYAIHRNKDEIATTRPDWILKDRGDNKLYIPFACSGGACPQYAADIGNPQFRADWIRKARQLLARGYVGLFVDDVNLTWRISNGHSTNTTPIDPRTGTEMTLESWQRYVAVFTEEIRSSFPNKEIIHNVIWFADSPRNPLVTRQIRAASHIYLERGINDTGLTGGGGRWGLETFFGFIDFVHSQSRGVIFDVIQANNSQAIEYGLAGWLLISEGDDAFGNRQSSNPDNWWSGYELNLGTGYGRRYSWSGVIRRDFQHGIVLLNQPGMSARTINLGQNYKTIDGRTISSITLSSSSGAILLKP